MASSFVLRRHLSDITKCPICLDVFDTPIALPCLHTFCLRCLQHTFATDHPGDVANCPVCRREFRVPTGGLVALPRNFTVDGLVEMCTMSRSSSAPSSVVRQTAKPASNDSKSCEIITGGETTNDVMLNVRENGRPASEATSGDDDCMKCSLSTPAHQHDQRSCAALTEDVTAMKCKCDGNGSAARAEFCFDCRLDMCGTCCGDVHRSHRRRPLSKVTAECRRRFAGELARVTDALDATHVSLVDVNRRRADILKQLQRDERFARRECYANDGDKTEQRLNALLAEKDDALRQLAASKELLDVDKMSMETFLNAGNRKLASATTTAGLLHVVKELKLETKSLLRVHQMRLDKSKVDGKQQTSSTTG